MADPVEGRFGSAVLSGWIADTPEGEHAFLLLTTPDRRAPVTLRAIAEHLGMRVGHDPVNLSTCRVEITDGWATLHLPGDTYTRPVDDEWARVARARGRVVLVIGTQPMAADVDPGAYVDTYGHRCALGLAPVR